jgi:hypothetical protein
MSPSIPSQEKIDKLKILTRRYSSLIKHAGGLSYLFSALLMMIVYFSMLALKFDTLPKMLICLGTFIIWIPIRNCIRVRYYQTLGMVIESKDKIKPLPDPKRKLKIVVFAIVLLIFGLIVPIVVFARLESITLEKFAIFISYITLSIGFGIYMAKSRIDSSLLSPALGFLAIALNDVQLFELEYQNRQGSLTYSLFFYLAVSIFMGIFEHIRYQRVTKEIIELQRSL